MRICKGCELLDLLNKLNDTQRKTIKVNLWSLDSWRDNAAYRARAATVNLETLWR